VAGLNLRSQLSDGAEPDTELIVACPILAVLRTDFLIAERFELRESFFESRSHICVVSEFKNRDNAMFTGRATPIGDNNQIGFARSSATIVRRVLSERWF
jgi:hypothetical protein